MRCEVEVPISIPTLVSRSDPSTSSSCVSPCASDAVRAAALPKVLRRPSSSWSPLPIPLAMPGVPAVAGSARIGLLLPELQCLHHRHVVLLEEDRLLAVRPVDMAVPGPQRHDEAVALRPVVFLAVDHGR